MRFFENGQNYLAAVSGVADSAGGWRPIDGLSEISIEVIHAITSGTITGFVYVEHTNQEIGTPSGVGSRILLPPGCLHTEVAAVTLEDDPDPSDRVALTAMGAGRFQIKLSGIGNGQMRVMFDYSTDSSAVGSTITVHITGQGKGC